MDTVTHGLAGWLVARAEPVSISAEARRTASAAAVVGAALPDADSLASLFGSEAYLKLHRGLSHGPAGIALSSLLVAFLFYRYGRWKEFRKLFLLVLLAQLSHVGLDLLNSYGTQVLAPFSDARFAFDILFVIDLVFTGIVLGGILLSRNGAGPARAALAVLLLYVAGATGMHLRAEGLVREAARRQGFPVVTARALPRLGELPADSGLRSLREFGVAWAGDGKELLAPLPVPDRPDSYPFPAGPFAWNGFVDDGRNYLRAEVDPLSGRVDWKQCVPRGGDIAHRRELDLLPEVRTYLWFARYPVVQNVRRGGTVVHTFSDLRFGEVPGRRRPFLLQVIETPGRPPEVRWGG